MWGRTQYVISLVALALIICIILVDFHLCRVVHFRARVLDKRILKEKKLQELREAEENKQIEDAVAEGEAKSEPPAE